MNDQFLTINLNNNKMLKVLLNKDCADNYIDIFNKIQEFKPVFNHATSYDINLCDENEYMKIINNFPEEIKNKINNVEVSEMNKERVRLNAINIECDNKLYTCVIKDSLYNDKEISAIKVRIKNTIQTFGDVNVDRINEALKNTGIKLVKFTKINNYKNIGSYEYNRT